MTQLGMIKPRSSNFADRLIESAGEGMGGALIPEVGLTARAGGTLADILKAMGPAASSGLASGATAEVAPDNPGANRGGTDRRRGAEHRAVGHSRAHPPRSDDGRRNGRTAQVDGCGGP